MLRIIPMLLVAIVCLSGCQSFWKKPVTTDIRDRDTAASDPCAKGGLYVDVKGRLRAFATGCKDAHEKPCESAGSETRLYCKTANDGIYRNSGKNKDKLMEVYVYESEDPVVWENSEPPTCCAVWGYYYVGSKPYPYCAVPAACP